MILAALCVSALLVATSTSGALPATHDNVGAVPDHDLPGRSDDVSSFLNRSKNPDFTTHGTAESTELPTIPISTDGIDVIERLNYDKQLVLGYTLNAIIKQCGISIDETILSKVNDKIEKIVLMSQSDEAETESVENIATSVVRKSRESSPTYCLVATLNINHLAHEYVSKPIIKGDGDLLQNETLGHWKIFPNMCFVITPPAQEARSLTVNFQASRIVILFTDDSWHWSAGQHMQAVIEADGLVIPTTDIGAKVAGTRLYAFIPREQFATLAHAGSIDLRLTAPYEQSLQFDIHGLDAAARRLPCITSKGYLSK